MKLSEFQLQPRGPYLFDHYIHPVRIKTPVGDFALEFHVDDAARRPPDERMLDAIMVLRDAFESDMASIISLIYKQYLLATEDEEWCEDLGLPTGLKEDELEPLLHGRSLTVSQDDIDDNDPHPGRVYMSPEWDEEHGLYFARIDNNWAQMEC